MNWTRARLSCSIRGRRFRSWSWNWAIISSMNLKSTTTSNKSSNSACPTNAPADSSKTNKKQEPQTSPANPSYSNKSKKCRKGSLLLRWKNVQLKKDWACTASSRQILIKKCRLKTWTSPNWPLVMNECPRNSASNKPLAWQCKLRGTSWWPRLKDIKIGEKVTSRWPISSNKPKPRSSCWNRRQRSGTRTSANSRSRDVTPAKKTSSFVRKT